MTEILNSYIASLTSTEHVIPAPISIGINSSGNPEKHWIPPYQVRGRFSQARNDKLHKIYVVMYKEVCFGHWRLET